MSQPPCRTDRGPHHDFFLRVSVGAALTILAVVSRNSAQATTITTDQLEAAFCPSHPDAKTLARLQKADSEFQCGNASTHNTAKQQAATHNVSSATQVAKADTPSKKPPIPPYAEYFVPTYFLRNSWSDLGLLGTGCFGPNVGVSVDKATGASVSFERDYANNNKIWAAQGMAGAVFSDCRNIPAELGGNEHGFVEKSIAIYAQINSDYNSNATFAKKNNLDTRTAGLSGEVAYLSNGLDYNVVRVTPNVVFDNIKNTTIGAVMVQYVPVWLSLPAVWSHYELFGSLWFQFDPTFDLQYASAMDQSKPLQFSGKDQSLRLGPELTFVVTPKTSKDNFWTNLGLSETFHPWYEAYDGHGSYWWSNTIFYNITTNFAVKFSYQRGLDENSGTMTNQYIASLSGKY